VEDSARLFFALWPSAAMQAALAAATAAAVIEAGKAADVRRVPAENLHLTLAFLGRVPLSRRTEVEDVASRCARILAADDAPIEIVLDGIEYWRKPQILCVTASQTPPVAIALAETLKRSLLDRGFSPDLKPFRVHATVARKIRHVTRELHVDPVRWHFEALHLIESRTSPTRSAYTPIREWRLR
jgi:2'-5' RNA ligase